MELKHGLLLASICCGIGLTACHSVPKPNKPSLTTEKIYHAPAQLFDFDLSSTALRGQIRLKQSCDASGTSLDLKDQLNQQIRIDTFNLHDAQFSEILDQNQQVNLKLLTTKLLALYQQRYAAQSISPAKVHKTAQADYVTARLQLAQHPIDVAIQTHYGYAYVIVLNSAMVYQDAEKAQRQLNILLKSLYIPGSRVKGSESDLPLRLDQLGPQSQKNTCSI